MAEISKNAFAAAAEVVASLSDLSNKQCSSSQDEGKMQSILITAKSMINNPEELKQYLTNLANLGTLSNSLKEPLSDLLAKVDRLCQAEQKAKASPKDQTLAINARRIEECVNQKLTKLQLNNNQELTADRISRNNWTTAENNVVAISKAILQG